MKRACAVALIFLCAGASASARDQRFDFYGDWSAFSYEGGCHVATSKTIDDDAVFFFVDRADEFSVLMDTSASEGRPVTRLLDTPAPLLVFPDEEIYLDVHGNAAFVSSGRDGRRILDYLFDGLNSEFFFAAETDGRQTTHRIEISARGFKEIHAIMREACGAPGQNR